MPDRIKRLTGDTKLDAAIEEMMTDRRAVAMVTLLDIVGDMNADGLEVLRRLGSDEYRTLTKFFREANHETIEFLTDLRPSEVQELSGGIELVRAFRTTGKFAKWAIISLATTLAAVLSLKAWWMGGK